MLVAVKRCPQSACIHIEIAFPAGILCYAAVPNSIHEAKFVQLVEYSEKFKFRFRGRKKEESRTVEQCWPLHTKRQI